MISIKDFMEAVDYRITEGSEFCWNCWGPNVHRLDSWSGALGGDATNGYSIGIYFDTQTQVVYCAEAHDYGNNRSYRLMNPLFQEAHDSEAKTRGIDPREAYDEVRFIDLESDADWIEKARAIVQGEEYDTRVTVDIEIDDTDLFQIMQMAHERDMTLNKFVEEILEAEVARLKSQEK